MVSLTAILPRCKPLRWLLFLVVCAAGYLALVWWLRQQSYAADPLVQGYFEVMGGLIAFTYAANALVRFRGTHDRISLILAFGFVVSGLIEVVSSLAVHRLLAESAGEVMTIPLAWMVGRTLLGLLLLLALAVERYLPSSREPGREIVAAILVVGGAAYLTSAFFLAAPAEPAIRPGAWIPRPWDLLPAAIYAAAAVGFWRRLPSAGSAFDRAICCAAVLNTVCHLVASQSQHLQDAPFAVAQVLKASSYAVVLCGALLDNARLFDQVRYLAASDPLTGLANYRRFVDVLDAELTRSQRTGRSFTVMLLDLDGLKKINDRHGHLVGSRAIGRLADVLRSQCRAMDTAARYGGDEFALVLPETGAEAAQQVARRISERLQADQEEPRLAASLGIAVYPESGQTIETLLAAADRTLYGMKGRRRKRVKALPRNVAACL